MSKMNSASAVIGKKRKHYAEFIFIEKSLHNLTIDNPKENSTLRSISQATVHDQEDYIAHNMDEDEDTEHSNYDEVREILKLVPGYYHQGEDEPHVMRGSGENKKRIPKDSSPLIDMESA